MLEDHGEKLARLGNRNRTRMLEFAEFEVRASFFVDGALFARARGLFDGNLWGWRGGGGAVNLHDW